MQVAPCGQCRRLSAGLRESGRKACPDYPAPDAPTGTFPRGTQRGGGSHIR